MTRCEKTDLLTSDCAHCRGYRDPDAPDLRVTRPVVHSAMWLTAEWPGRCTGCGDRYPSGVQIIRDGNGWRSECCAETD